MDIQEIIDLLSEIFVIADNDESDDEPLASFPRIKKLADQALTILKQQPKATSIGNKIREIASKDILGQTKLVRDKDILNQAADRLDAWWKYINELKEEVDLLKQPKCHTCKDTGKVTGLGDLMLNDPKFPEKYPATMVCPDCQQPTAGELTTEIRNALRVQTRLNPEQEKKAIIICDRLDRAESINADLLEACEPFARLADMIPAPDAPEPQWKKFNTAMRALPLDRYREAQAAIAKAKK